MHHIYQTEGIVISGRAVGETNRKIYLFGREVGLITASVQSGRSLQSKLRPSVQDFTLGNYSLVRGRNEWKLVGAKAEINIFENIKNNSENSKEKIRLLGNVLTIIKRLVEEGVESYELYDAVKDFLLALPNIKGEELKSAECLILLRILNKLGFLRADPDLVVCIEEKGITEKAIQTMQIHKLKTVKLINESLKAAEVEK